MIFGERAAIRRTLSAVSRYPAGGLFLTRTMTGVFGSGAVVETVTGRVVRWPAEPGASSGEEPACGPEPAAAPAGAGISANRPAARINAARSQTIRPRRAPARGARP